MRSALVLNASYEPLSVVSARRAACLVLADKADIIEDDGTELHSPSIVLPSPLVDPPALHGQGAVPPPHRAVAAGRVRPRRLPLPVLRPAGRLDRPRDAALAGGEHVWENVAAACRPCNLAKRDRTPDEAGMRLARPCRAPRATAWVVVSVARVPEAWKPYLAIAS